MRAGTGRRFFELRLTLNTWRPGRLSATSRDALSHPYHGEEGALRADRATSVTGNHVTEIDREGDHPLVPSLDKRRTLDRKENFPVEGGRKLTLFDVIPLRKKVQDPAPFFFWMS
jgi:hypothetical protein